MTNLGKALTILARAEAREYMLHDDVAAYGAPGECHGIIKRGEAARLRLARRHAEAVARRPLRVIRRDAARRGVIMHDSNRHWCRAVEGYMPF